MRYCTQVWTSVQDHAFVVLFSSLHLSGLAVLPILQVDGEISEPDASPEAKGSELASNL